MTTMTTEPVVNTEKYIGKVLKTHQLAFEAGCYSWETKIIPFIKGIVEKYKKLKIGDFSKQALFDLFKNNSIETEKLLENSLKQYLEAPEPLRLGFLKSMKESLEPIKNAAYSLGEVIERENRYWRFSHINLDPFNLENCDFVGEVPTLDKKKYKKHFEIRIENEDQNDIYCRFLPILKSLNDFRDFMVSKKYPIDKMTIIGDRGFAYEDDDCIFHFIPESINYIYRF